MPPHAVRKWSAPAVVAVLWGMQAVVAHAVFGALYPSARIRLTPHLFLLGVWVAALDVAAMVLPRRPAVAVWALRVLAGGSHAVLLVVLACVFGGYRAWNSALTLPMIVSYADEPAHVSALLGVPVGAVYAAVIGLGAGLAWAYGGLARRWVDGAVGAGRRWPRRFWASAAVVGLAVASTALRPVRVWMAHEMVRVWAFGGAINGSAPPTLLIWPRQTGLDSYLASVDRAALQRRPLVLIVVDAMRLDQMHVYGHRRDNTPFLSASVAAGQMQRMEARSTCTTSYCGLLGLLGSRYWAELVRPPVTLGEVLRGLGYQTHYVLSGDHTSFYNLRRLTADGATFYHDGTDGGGANSNDDRAALARLRTVAFTDSTFVYVHLMSTHLIADRLPEHRRWSPSDLSFYQNVAHPDSLRTVNAYHNGLLQTDAYLRQIYELLAERGVLDRALVIVTADHVEHLGERGRYGHGTLPYEPVVRVPLFVSHPGEAPWAPRPLASGIDVAPTFLHAIGAPVPPFWSGAPLQVKVDRSAVYVGSVGAGGVVAEVRGGLYKYIRHRLDGREEIYRLTDDPLETLNLASNDAALREELRRRLALVDTL